MNGTWCDIFLLDPDEGNVFFTMFCLLKILLYFCLQTWYTSSLLSFILLNMYKDHNS